MWNVDKITDGHSTCHDCVKVGRNGGPKSWTRAGKVNSKHTTLLWDCRQNKAKQN